MITIKSIMAVQLGNEWVVRARLSDNAERFKGMGAGYKDHDNIFTCRRVAWH